MHRTADLELGPGPVAEVQALVDHVGEPLDARLRRARRHVEEGAVTQFHSENRETVIRLLNEALATELVCVLRYRHDYFMARGLAGKAAADEFLETAKP